MTRNKSGQVIGLVGGNGGENHSVAVNGWGYGANKDRAVQGNEFRLCALNGVVPESTGLYSRLTAENIRYHSKLQGKRPSNVNRVSHLPAT